jgi:hypothetical protein
MDVLELFAAVAAFAGLAGVFAEIWLKDRTVFIALATDLRGFADPSRKFASRPARVVQISAAPVPANDRAILQAA